MARFAAVVAPGSARGGCGWGRTTVAPATASADHDQGDSAADIYTVSGHPECVFLTDPAERGAEPEEVRLRTGRLGEGRQQRLK